MQAPKSQELACFGTAWPKSKEKGAFGLSCIGWACVLMGSILMRKRALIIVGGEMRENPDSNCTDIAEYMYVTRLQCARNACLQTLTLRPWHSWTKNMCVFKCFGTNLESVTGAMCPYILLTDRPRSLSQARQENKPLASDPHLRHLIGYVRKTCTCLL